MARSLRRLGIALSVPLALALSGCGIGYATLQQYTPAEGVNRQVGNVKVRNVLIIANDAGQGVVSGSVVSSADDTLTAISGTPVKADGAAGSPLVVTSTGLPLNVPNNNLIVLTNPPVRVAVTSPDLKPGLLVDVTMTFSKAGPVQMRATVVSSDDPQFEGITVGG